MAAPARWAKGIAATATLIFLLGSTATCTSDPITTTTEVPGPDPIPAITWPNGIPDDGELDGPWTRALRNYLTSYAAAFNTRTVGSSQRLARLAGEELRAQLAEQEYWDEYMPGPLPMVVSSIAEKSASTVIIEVCAHNQWRLEISDDVSAPTGLQRGWRQRWLVENLDGTYLVNGTVLDLGDNAGTCSLEGLQYGLFDPNPFNI